MSALDDMVEAMIAADSGPIGSPLFAIHAREFADSYRASLVTALTAIRAPTPAVIEAMRREIGPLTSMWTAAIDAILEEEG